MPRRKSWKKGDWLVIDEESGITRYASQVRRDWKGLYVTNRYADEEQEQDFIKPMQDPQPVAFTALPDRNFEICNCLPRYVGATTVPYTSVGAATHLFQVDGIGDMSIGCSFVVG